MNTENLAERLFCDLKNAGVKIEPAWYQVNGAKIGQFKDSHQLVIFGNEVDSKFSFGYGPGSTGSFNESFTESYTKLLDIIVSYKHVKFYSLLIPNRGVIEVKLLEFDKVVGRYIKDYLHLTDQTLVRWDFMVQKVED